MDKSTVNLIIEYTDFEVYEKEGKYYYYDYNDCRFTPLVLIAKERSNVLEDLDDLDTISKYECDVCGESVDGKYYYWFKYDKEILYLIRLDWSTYDERGTDIFVAKTRERAISFAKKLIQDEIENNWVGCAFKNGKLRKGYELITNLNKDNHASQLYWNLMDENEPSMHDYITIEKLETY